MVTAVLFAVSGIVAAQRSDWPVAALLLVLSLPFDYLTVRWRDPRRRPGQHRRPPRHVVPGGPGDGQGASHGLTGQEVRQLRFQGVRHGYDPRGVDALLEDVATAIDNGEGDAAERLLGRAQLPRARYGYRRDEVDKALARLKSGT
jgi:DivIVA domain-containing protein